MTKQEKTCCGVVEEARIEAREKHNRRANKPQPWIVLKLTVGIMIGLIAYACYVYIDQLCLNMIFQRPNALGSRTMGRSYPRAVVFLSIFCAVTFMMLWCYITVCCTSPGHARDFVPVTQRPGTQPPPPLRSSSISDDIRGTSYELTSPTVDLSRPPTHDPEQQTHIGTGQPPPDQSPRLSRRSGNADSHTLVSAGSMVAKQDQRSSQAISQDSGPPRESSQTHNVASTSTNAPVNPPNVSEGDLPPPIFSRRPPTTPILNPEYRYCSRDKIMKPYRCHHCRACGTCILKYDHHCPWIGQCVGAFNQKFFFDFVLWGAIFTIWTFGSLLGLVVRGQHQSPPSELNPQHIAVIVLTGLFGIFSFMMTLTQIRSLMLNQTTVESLNFRAMREREQATLSHMYAWYQIRAKRRTVKEWDQEWGKTGTEGNLWYLGSEKENWEIHDGMDYPPNPRYDSQGRQRRRKEWPVDLQ
ncbi:zf-DHHC-domain-containing protein [Coniophora puteana RWD-64-598 SS2]|uniref:Palmitoyltransferase n=1 Tax=Coniophora puteana (strain RWD-64-598) TaxID=741705 RepID=A0A5M3MBZ9_CONPW|nr:zf-DHHC-domain-containing protein [Coniophora puteana RWD-64-598 SS2]EIW76567.1 zf-DHHC-domain-containing protein [Coniophora puteana RWD-64-598 SS2]